MKQAILNLIIAFVIIYRLFIQYAMQIKSNCYLKVILTQKKIAQYITQTYAEISDSIIELTRQSGITAI